MKDADVALEKVRFILAAQAAGKIDDAQKAYEWLMGWCDGKGYDFLQVFEACHERLRKTACGVLDTAAYSGAMN